MTDVPGGSLGEAVREALTRSDLTVEQVSATTRIRASLIRDLQDGRTGTSGGDVYARGHLKAIAHATGADAGPLLTAYERESGSRVPEPVGEHTVHLTGQRAGSLALPKAEAPERRGPRWGLAVAVAAALLVGLVAVGNLTSGADGGADSGDEQQVVAEDAPTPPVAPPSPAATVPPDATASRPPATGATLRVRVDGGSSWVLVQSGTTRIFEGVLPDGTVRDFADPATLSVKVGNAGAVSLICGGKDVPAGGSGQVKSFSCAQDGLVPA